MQNSRKAERGNTDTMATVSIQVKNNTWYGVISYKDAAGKWKQKWFSTGLLEKGNKKRAQKIADAKLAEFDEPSQLEDENLLLTDYLENHWLVFAKDHVELTTYAGYEAAVMRAIIPYFEPKKIRLKELDSKTIQKFYYEMQHHGGKRGQRLKGTTIRRYHAVLHRALHQAVKLELIKFNPADNVDLPKKDQIIHSIFSEKELCALIDLTKDEDIGLLIKLEAFYGMRRSESLGLRWQAIDFDNDTLTVNHTVVAIRENGTSVLHKKDRTKNSSSYRTLPLNDELKQDLFALREQHTRNKEWFGDGYNTEDEDYVFVDVLGNLFYPDYVSRKFARLLKKHGLKKIRFHDLRHTVASLMVKHDVPMKYIQNWMGHSDFSTTANIYAHVDSDASKDQMAGVMTDILGMYREERTTGENTPENETGVTSV